LICGSLGSYESTCQMASRSVQPFLQISHSTQPTSATYVTTHLALLAVLRCGPVMYEVHFCITQKNSVALSWSLPENSCCWASVVIVGDRTRRTTDREFQTSALQTVKYLANFFLLTFWLSVPLIASAFSALTRLHERHEGHPA